jgi:hypothetical protein
MSVVNTTSAKKWAKTLSDIKRYGFLTLAVVITLGASYYFYSIMNRPVAGVLTFLGSGLIFFYYWIKWFNTPDTAPDPDFMSNTYACPDYLSVIPQNAIDPITGNQLYEPSSPTQYFCVDYVGVSRNGGLKKMYPDKIVENIKNPAYTFSIDPLVDFKTGSGRGAFMQRLQQAGLTYNSMGDSTIPSRRNNSNGSPSYRG